MFLLVRIGLLITITPKVLPQDLDGSLSIPALGRPFTLGALYDIRSDRLLGVKLWNKATLEQNVLYQRLPSLDAKVIASNSLNDKANAFDIEAELKISFLGGLVKAKGAGKQQVFPF